jgi:hypothetical protein
MYGIVLSPVDGVDFCRASPAAELAAKAGKVTAVAARIPAASTSRRETTDRDSIDVVVIFMLTKNPKMD